MGQRRRVVVGFVGVCAIALLGAVAYACTPQASLRLTPSSGAAGTKMTISGSTFDSTGGQAKVYWGGAAKGTLIGSFPVTAGRTFSASFTVPADAPGGAIIVSATQSDASGQSIPGSPVNAVFTVTGAPPAGIPALLQGSPEENGIVEPALAGAPAATPAPVATPTPAPAPRVRVAPAAPARATPAPAAAAPVATPAPEATPVAEATPTPAPAPAPEATPAAAPRRSVMVSMGADSSDGSPALAIALVGVGLVLALGATALVLAGRRERKAPASARR